MTIDFSLNHEKLQIKEILVKLIQDLRINARDIDDFKKMRELKREIKEYQNYLDFLNSEDELNFKKI
jgi:hypothetical protein